MPLAGDGAGESSPFERLEPPAAMRAVLAANPFVEGDELFERFGVRLPQEGGRRRLTLERCAAVLLLFAAIGGAFTAWRARVDSAARERVGRAVLEKATQELDAGRQETDRLGRELLAEREKSRSLEWALDVLKPRDYERQQRLFVSYVPPLSTEYSPSGRALVKVRNVQFPCYLRWTAGDEEQVHALPAGDSEWVLPAGNPVTAFCGPLHAAGWLQAVFVQVQRSDDSSVKPGSVLGKIPLALRDGDQVELFFQQPVAPWNAVCVPLDGEWIMVTLERPWAELDLDTWREGRWTATERFPNSMLFWAHYGPAEWARQLVDFFFEHREDAGAWGRFRANNHLGLVVRSGENSVSEAMRRVDRRELEAAVVGAIELLRTQRPPRGPTIAEELEIARRTLRVEGLEVRD